ncbi:carboxylating nicotinate-nucleotide diphosphorylase [Clostridiaceae bacterium HSG29]|nr:carboxylating nicotinate-nucleotide diphosphorylase [Clostridiaceae bacterium HSG29]
MVNKYLLEDIIKRAIIEDLNNGDVTTDNLIGDNHISSARMTVKEDGTVSGFFVAKKVFEMIDSEVVFHMLVKEGAKVKKGTDILEIQGKTKSILKAERLALNFMQRMSGISTLANKFNEIVKDYDVRIVDTRKTTPNLRLLEKAAVKIGGCYNHRYNLSDAVMIKDNHIVASGGIKNAVEKIRENIPHTTKIEVEVQTIEMLKEALEVNADIIMLDNMSNELMKEAVKINNKKAILEASGGINEETVLDVAKTGVDVISLGALTHSYKSLDISLNIK